MAFRKVFGSALQALRGEQVLFIPSRGIQRCLNLVQLLGRAGKEPAIVGESKLMFMPFVTEENRRLQDGTVTLTATWHRIIIGHNFLLDRVCPSIVKGHRLYIEGSLYYRNLETGEKSSYILARQIILLERPVRVEERDDDFGSGSLNERDGDEMNRAKNERRM